jgi:hypothetical protein
MGYMPQSIDDGRLIQMPKILFKRNFIPLEMMSYNLIAIGDSGIASMSLPLAESL